MRQKLIATGIGITLVTLAAVGAFASQDPVNVVEDPTATVTETATAEATNTPDATATATPDGTETPEATATGTPEPTATGEVEATETPGDDDDDIHGIPDSNPSHFDEDGDGVCEKGETIIKTTPSGNQVRVPCHAAKHEDKEKHGKSDDGDDADEVKDDADEVEDDGEDVEDSAQPHDADDADDSDEVED